MPSFLKSTDKVIPKLRNKINHKLLINSLNPFIHGTLMIKRDSFYKLNGYMKILFMHKIINYFMMLSKVE